MPKYPEKKVKNYIHEKIKDIEENAEKLIQNESYGYFDENEFEYIKVGGIIELTNLEFKTPTKDYSEYTTSNLYDLTFSISHNGKSYTFETSNYYFYEYHKEFVVEDILENIDVLLEKFRFLLEWMDYIFISSNGEDEDDEDNMTIDEVASTCGFYIDDDGHWVPKENDYFFDDFNEEERFRDNLEFVNGYYIYNDIDDNGRFYWEELNE